MAEQYFPLRICFLYRTERDRQTAQSLADAEGVAAVN